MANLSTRAIVNKILISLQEYESQGGRVTKRLIREVVDEWATDKQWKKVFDKVCYVMLRGEQKMSNPIRTPSKPVRIPEKVLDWRLMQRHGKIMKTKTFKGIERRAARRGYRDPSAVGGKAYWITVLNKYLDEFPGDKAASKALRRLLATRSKIRGRNPRLRRRKRGPWPSLGIRGKRGASPLMRMSAEWPIGHPYRKMVEEMYKKKNPKRKKWYLGIYNWSGSRVVFSSIKAPTKKTHGDRYLRVIGPFDSFREAKIAHIPRNWKGW